MKKLILKKSGFLTSAALLSLLCISQVTSAGAKPATCQIDEEGTTIYKGKCLFTSQGGGSFYISGKELSKKVGVEGVMVWIEQTNVAVVQGTKFSGGSSTWGQAVRSKNQKACWIGEGNSFKVCAW